MIQSIGNAREIPRIGTKLKLVTGTYIFQSNRATFNQNVIGPTCLLCKNGEETIKHFLLNCTALSIAREPTIDITDTCASLLSKPTNARDRLLQLILAKCDLHKLKNFKADGYIMRCIVSGTKD